MAGQIRKEQIIDEPGIVSAFDNLSKSILKAHDAIDSVVNIANELGNASGFKEILKWANQAHPANKKVAESLHEVSDQQRDFNRVLTETGKIYARNKNAEEGRTRALEEQKVKRQELTKAIREEITGEQALAEVRKKEAAQSKQLTGQMIEYVNSIGKTNDGLKQLNAYYKELEKESNKAVVSQKKLNDEQAKNKARVNAAQTKQLNGILREHVAALTATNPQLKKMGDYYRQLERESERARKAEEKQAAQSERLANQKKRLGGVFGNLIKSIGVYGAALFGLTRIVQFFTRDLLQLTEKLDSLDFSLKTVIKSQEEQAQTQKFLADTAKNYGQDILTLTERYIKFRAAAQQSNLSVQDTQKIFNSAAKSAAVLGLRTDEVNGVFLALEQMISKGKVTTEELRRQLGERLPGAFGIMADAIGVSIRELDRMLKAGEVLSTEALPKFADALQKAYGIEAVDTVDTLAAAHGRLKTSWVEFVDALGASGAYKGALNVLTQFMTQLDLVVNNLSLVYTRTSKLTEDEVSRSFDFLLRLNSKKAREFQTVIKSYSDSTLEEIKNNRVKIIGELNDVYRISLEQAEMLYDEFLKRTANKLTENKSTGFADIFSLEEWQKNMDKVKDDAESLANVENKDLKESIIKSNKYLSERVTTYKQVLELQDKELNTKRKLAESIVDDFERQKTMGELSKDDQKRYEFWSNRYIALTEAQIDVANRLAEAEGKDKKGNDRLKKLQEQQKAEVEATKQNQAVLIRQYEEGSQEQLQAEFDNRKEILLLQQKQLEEQLKLVEKGSVDYYKIKSDQAENERQLAEDLTDYLVNEEKRRQRKLENTLKENSSKAYNELYDNIIKQQTLNTQNAAKELELNKNNAAKIQEIRKELVLANLTTEQDMVQAAIDGNVIIGDDEERLKDRLLDILKAIEEGKLDLIVKENKSIEESVRKTISAASQIAGQAFDIVSTVYDTQMQRIEELHDYEIAAAGDSVEERLKAERKYEREKAKILRKQAIAEKAQTMFSIIINTASAVVEALPNVVLAAIIGGLGAVQLGVVAAQPIPKFAEGVENNPFETFIAGEEGNEVILTPDGQAVLTPDRPTLFSDKSFIGSTILPHDETQKWLANYAVSQSYDMVDMSESNRHLKKLVSNTQSKAEYFEIAGKQYRKRGYVTQLIR